MAYKVTSLYKAYGKERVLGGLDLEFPAGKVTVVLGPSGCGKTSLLNILAGLDKAYSGSVTGFESDAISYVFQEDRLLPWMGAKANIAFALRNKMGKELAEKAATDALLAVGLAPYLEARPGSLSGGMRRRVALARAFAYPSDLFLLDEPFSSLDLKTRIAVMDLFLKLRASDGRGAVIVTHDVREAIYLADRIVSLSEKPSVVVDSLDIDMSRADRSFASGAAAALEARLYASILSPAHSKEWPGH
ncbi:ABC transporter ATP-binding protein [Spirochaetota bacterium]